MEKTSENIDYRDYKKFSFTLRKDGIVHYLIKANVLLSLSDIQEHYQYFEKNYKGQTFLNVYEFESNAEIDNDIRKWGSDPTGNTFTIADAIIMKSMPQKIIGNFYLTFHKPIKPTKLFNNVEDAIKWLNSLR
jgi:hypothetical protein